MGNLTRTLIDRLQQQVGWWNWLGLCHLSDHLVSLPARVLVDHLNDIYHLANNLYLHHRHYLPLSASATSVLKTVHIICMHMVQQRPFYFYVLSSKCINLSCSMEFECLRTRLCVHHIYRQILTNIVKNTIIKQWIWTKYKNKQWIHVNRNKWNSWIIWDTGSNI